ncbi:hypothetical protein PGT21_030510 [Puccinia graminis f. sp. tritici]|uniref:Uncharacterized protein n=1 Tax=Puccinia graminis f. sp. tritici TaxID=56615 RepID=A0A5B0PF21_PUCGR|nr:hypothetical protein PGT21_030510 [Puccinia graminis f. sp. tritici]KAA1099224.1 hypothetical protein PGTUg99_023275 [Puccinia graminis f. sp. tritici]
MLLKSILMMFCILYHCMLPESFAKSIVKRSIFKGGETSSLGESPFGGPLYKSVETVYDKGKCVVTTYYCTPPKVAFSLNGKDISISLNEFLNSSTDSLGISEKEKEKVTKTLLSERKGAQGFTMGQKKGQELSAEEKNQIWPNGPPRFAEKIRAIDLCNGDRTIFYKYSHTPYVVTEVKLNP